MDLAESTFEDIQERPRLDGRRGGLVRNRKRTTGTMKPVLFLMPTLSDVTRILSCVRAARLRPCDHSPLNEDWIPRRGVELEDARLGVLGVLTANDNRAVCRPTGECA